MNNIIPSDEVLEATKLIQYENLYITLEQQVKEFISLNYKNKLLIDDDIYEKSIGNIKEKIMEMEKNINLLNELYIAPTDIKEKVFEIDKYDIKKYYYKEWYFDFLNEEIIKLFKIELKEYLQS
jgi:hypothetical protein